MHWFRGLGRPAPERRPAAGRLDTVPEVDVSSASDLTVAPAEVRGSRCEASKPAEDDGWDFKRLPSVRAGASDRSGAHQRGKQVALFIANPDFAGDESSDSEDEDDAGLVPVGGKLSWRSSSREDEHGQQEEEAISPAQQLPASRRRLSHDDDDGGDAQQPLPTGRRCGAEFNSNCSGGGANAEASRPARLDWCVPEEMKADARTALPRQSTPDAEWGGQHAWAIARARSDPGPQQQQQLREGRLPEWQQRLLQPGHWTAAPAAAAQQQQLKPAGDSLASRRQALGGLLEWGATQQQQEQALLAAVTQQQQEQALSAAVTPAATGRSAAASPASTWTQRRSPRPSVDSAAAAAAGSDACEEAPPSGARKRSFEGKLVGPAPAAPAMPSPPPLALGPGSLATEWVA